MASTEDSDNESVINSQLQTLRSSRIQAETMGISATHPVLLEVEHIIQWLELFNGLLSGLVQLNGILEKSYSCQKKLSQLINHRHSKGPTSSHQTCSSTQVASKSPNSSSSDSETEYRQPLPRYPIDQVTKDVSDLLTERVASLLQKTHISIQKSRETSSHSSNKRTWHRSQKSKHIKIPERVVPDRVDVSCSKSTLTNGNSSSKKESNEPVAWMVTFPKSRYDKNLDEDSLNIQRIFQQKCSKLIERSQKRCEYINTKAMLRKVSAERKLADDQYAARIQSSVLRNKSPESKPYHPFRPNEVKVKRVFTHREMRHQTEKRYTKLPEVKQKIEQKKTEDFRRLHRIMKDVFTEKVKRETLKGRMHFPITQNFIVY